MLLLRLTMYLYPRAPDSIPCVWIIGSSQRIKFNLIDRYRYLDSTCNGWGNQKCAECWRFSRSTAFGRRQGSKKGVCGCCSKKNLFSKGPLFGFFHNDLITASAKKPLFLLLSEKIAKKNFGLDVYTGGGNTNTIGVSLFPLFYHTGTRANIKIDWYMGQPKNQKSAICFYYIWSKINFYQYTCAGWLLGQPNGGFLIDF